MAKGKIKSGVEIRKLSLVIKEKMYDKKEESGGDPGRRFLKTI